VCKATAEQFQVIDRQVVEAIAEAEGTTFEEDTFDGKKLKWTAEARRALREVTDAYLRRRAKARIEKVARMQKLSVITRDLAMPLIEDTVGSERLAKSQGPADHEHEAGAEVSASTATQRVVSRPTRTQPSVSSNPHLNWTSDTGNLNEIMPGRVVVLAPPGHSAPEDKA
jgi:hypothetical protein